MLMSGGADSDVTTFLDVHEFTRHVTFPNP